MVLGMATDKYGVNLVEKSQLICIVGSYSLFKVEKTYTGYKIKW